MTRRWLKLTIAYDGTGYAGWQIQPDKPTVQGAIESAWRQITQEDARITAAGRTDAGVHALGQVAAIVTESRLSNDDLLRALNAVLPNDIAILAIEPAPEGFHATRDAIGKTYRYQIHNGRVPSVFDRHFAWHYPQPLDASAMHAAGQSLLGRYDFSSFESAGSERPDSIRTIYALSVVRHVAKSLQDLGGSDEPLRDSPALSESLPHVTDRITLEVTGDGFLYNMVRTIVGTLVEVGKGARSVKWPAEVLAARDRRQAGQTAPPQGLFLVCVEYPSTDIAT